MASQVLSGASNPSYTNNTGQNVRIVINYMTALVTRINIPPGSTGIVGTSNLTINWAGVSIPFSDTTNNAEQSNGQRLRIPTIGRNIAYVSPENATPSNNMIIFENSQPTTTRRPIHLAYPTELMLAPGQTFSATCGIYNIVVIPEAG